MTTDEPEMELPEYLEVRPGEWKRQSEMTPTDWHDGLVLAAHRRDEAEAELVEKAYDMVRPLLTDDKMTTADVAHLLGPLADDEFAQLLRRDDEP